VIPGNRCERQLQAGKKPLKVPVLRRLPRVYQIAGDDDEGRTGPKPIELCNQTREGGGSVDPAVSELALALDVQVGDLRN